MTEMETKFLDPLEAVCWQHPTLIPPTTDVSEEFGVSRSFCRGATPVATNKGAPSDIIEAIGRWRKSRHPNITIREHYTDVLLILDRLLKFSSYL